MNCKAENCKNKLQSNNKSGYCREHYYPYITKMKRKQTHDERIKIRCKIENCENVLNSGNTTGYCKKHLNHSPDIKTRKNQWINQKRSGLTEKEYEDLLAQQGGSCASCKTTTPGGIGRFHTDHDHNCCPNNSCGECVRGLLCSNCNMALGLLHDDPVKILALLEYIEKSRSC